MNRDLVIVGDICLAGRPSVDDCHRLPLSRDLTAVVGYNTCLVGTIEAPVSNGGRPKPHKACLKGQPGALKLLAGFEVGLLGNNHIEDFGVESAISTLMALNDMGCRAVGYGNTLSEAMAPAVVNLGEVRLALVSHCCPTTRADGFATDRIPGVAPVSLQLLRESIKEALKQAELVVVCPHWGVQGASLPTLDDLLLARACIEAGAHAVVGTHAHVVQATEIYRGAPIVYGLGNYLFDDVNVEYVDHQGRPSGRRYCVVQSEENRTSLVVALRPVRSGDSWALELSGRWLARQAADMSITHHRLQIPTKADRWLESQLARLPLDLSRRAEPSYACSVRDGILVYDHRQPPLDQLSFTRASGLRLAGLARAVVKRAYRR